MTRAPCPIPPATGVATAVAAGVTGVAALPSPTARRAWILGAVAALALLATGVGCKNAPSPEDEIRALFKAGADAIEARDLSAATALLADDYKDPGGRTRDNLKGIAFVLFRQGPIGMSIRDLQITLTSPTTATTTLQVLVLQGAESLQSARDLLPSRGRALDLTVDVHKRSGKWQVSAIAGDNLGGFGQ